MVPNGTYRHTDTTRTLTPTAVLQESFKDHPFTGMVYGRHGTPTSFALEEAFAVVEGADNACCVASGVAAVNVAMLAFLQVHLSGGGGVRVRG